MLLLRLFPLTRTCLKWGLFIVGLRLFDFCLIFEEIICFSINTELSAGGMGSLLADSCQERECWVCDRNSSSFPSVSLLKVPAKTHIRPLQLLLTSSWSRCATTSHRNLFLKSIWNKFFISEQWQLCQINTKHVSSVPENLPKSEYTSIVTI